MHDPTSVTVVWIGQWTTTPCASSTTWAWSSSSSMSSTPAKVWPRCVDASNDAVLGGWRSSDLTVRWSMRCWKRNWRSLSCRRGRSKHSVSATGPRATSPTGPTPMCSLIVYAPTDTVGDPLQPDSPATVTLRRPRSCPQGSRRDPCRGREPAASTPAHRVPWRCRTVQRDSTVRSRCGSSSGSRPPTSARWLSEKRLGTWLRANHYSGSKSPLCSMAA
jgi:hypothetical protein